MPSPSNSARSIFLIEDEEVLAELLKRKLEAAGYLVTVYSDGAAGIAAIRSTTPDLVLLDMQLPKMNGMEVLRTLSKEHITPGLPVFIISNSGQPIEIELAKELGVRDYLIKLNFEPDEILNKVNILLNVDRADAGAKDASMGHEIKGPSVLVVEDDVFLSELLARAMYKKHFKVDSAPNVDQARTILNQKQIDLICLDALLPGTDGFTFLRELKATPAFKHIPVLILSNLGQKEEMEKGMQLGAAGYYIKATKSPNEIVEKVASLLHV